MTNMKTLWNILFASILLCTVEGQVAYGQLCDVIGDITEARMVRLTIFMYGIILFFMILHNWPPSRTFARGVWERLFILVLFYAITLSGCAFGFLAILTDPDIKKVMSPHISFLFFFFLLAATVGMIYWPLSVGSNYFLLKAYWQQNEGPFPRRWIIFRSAFLSLLGPLFFILSFVVDILYWQIYYIYSGGFYPP